MAYIRKRRSGTYEIVIKHHSLPQPINASADTEAQARAWAEKVEAQIRAKLLVKPSKAGAAEAPEKD